MTAFLGCGSVWDLGTFNPGIIREQTFSLKGNHTPCYLGSWGICVCWKLVESLLENTQRGQVAKGKNAGNTIIDSRFSSSLEYL